MKGKVFILFLLACAMAGCTHTVRFYPLQGPMSAQSPLPVLVAKFTGAFNSGNVSLVLPDGEVCNGRWDVIRLPQPAKGGTATAAPVNEGMPSVWDFVYGQGFYRAQVLGARLHAQAMLTGNRGTTLNVEMYRALHNSTQAAAGEFKGIAKDSKDNIFKLVF
jgi:hypothetical protein